MADIQTLFNLIKPDIDKIEVAMHHDIAGLATSMDALLLEILQYGLFGGGKRLRPLLAVIAARLCNNRNSDIYNLAISFEYLHLATLFHDDVIDQADTRRGKPSVCSAYGLAPAILAGDFLHARSMAIVGKYAGNTALELFCEATSGIVDGEFLQIRNATNFNQSEDDYYKAILGKTALLIAATTQIGGLFGGATLEQQLALKEYGRNLGCAFQIVDDLLDYLGAEEKTGKVVGNDLVEGKMTLPLILTMEKAEKKDKTKLLAILSDKKNRLCSFTEVRQLIEKYDGFTLTKLRAEQFVEKALRQLDVFAKDKAEEIEIFSVLAQYVLVREK